MSDFPKQISAPALNSTYGTNVKQTFENIDSNFNVLANRELYKGDAGTNLVTVNAPWSAVFSNNPTITVGGYTITNFGSDIRAALGAIQGATTTDVNSVVNSLAASNWTIAVSFVETEGTATVISCIPYVFVDPRFRNEGVISSNLQNCTDLSCVITHNGSSTVNGGWVCTQNFPTLYYDYDSETSEGNLYWIINGQKTKILAQGPKGKDGSTGAVYVGLTDDLKLYSSNDSSHSSHNGGVNGGTLDGGVENIDITYLLCTSQLTDDQKSGLSDSSKYPFIPIADWVAIYGSPMTAPIMVLPEDPISSTIDTEVVSPYYISTTYVGTGETTTVSSTVSKYNICYCHMTDVMIKNAIRNNVLRLPNGFPTTSVGDGVIPGYSIKESIGDGGYCIFVPNSGVLTIAYVTDVDEPSESNWDNNNSKLKIVANIAAGYETGLGHIYSNGLGTLAHGFAMDASTIETNSNGSHAEGYVANEAGANGGSHIKSDASALGGYARGVAVNGGLIKTGGAGAYAGGYADGDGIGTASGDDNDSLIKSTGQGAHAEGYTATLGHIKASADGSFANGYAGGEGEIKATALGAHAEGAVDGADAVISADGWGAHAEGYADAGCIIVASQPGAHAEGSADDHSDIKSSGIGSHVEGRSIRNGYIHASNDGAHAEGYSFDQSFITAEGLGAHAEGYAEGTNNQILAYGEGAHAEGYVNAGNINALGKGTHAEGCNTTALGNYSHAEGCNAQSLGHLFKVRLLKVVGNSYIISGIPLTQFDNITSSSTASIEELRNAIIGTRYHFITPTIDQIVTINSCTSIMTSPRTSNDLNRARYNFYQAWGPYFEVGQANESATGVEYNMIFDVLSDNIIGKYSIFKKYLPNRGASHAEGYGTTASGQASHAEGYNTTASGQDSHAEGDTTTASGQDSHAEGYNTTASGQDSHAEGYVTTASGQASHASGISTMTTGPGEFACGKYNASGNLWIGIDYTVMISSPDDTNTSSHRGQYAYWSGGKIIFSVGVGGTSFTRKNAFFITSEGNMYVYAGKYNADGYINSNATSGSYYKQIKPSNLYS